MKKDVKKHGHILYSRPCITTRTCIFALGNNGWNLGSGLFLFTLEITNARISAEKPLKSYNRQTSHNQLSDLINLHCSWCCAA